MSTRYFEDPTVAIGYLHNAKNIRLEVQEYKTGRDRNSYYDKHDNLYDSMMNNIDELTFFVDLTSELRDEFDYNQKSTIEEFIDIMSDKDIEDLDGYKDLSEEQQDEVLGMNLDDLKNFNETMHKSILAILDELTDDDLDIRNDGNILFDCNYIDEKIDAATYESLAYWTVYFEPNYFDEEIAQRVGLTPFEYEDTQLLALGGCGMDLSPKLDAYIALVFDHIPEDSMFFRQKDYFEYVVGSKITKEIEEKCKLEQPHYILSFDHKDNTQIAS